MLVNQPHRRKSKSSAKGRWVRRVFDLQRNNLLLTEREGRTGKYWPEVVAVRTERSEVRAKTTEGQYSPVRLEQARLVSSLLYGTRAMLASNLPAFENKQYACSLWPFPPYGEIPTKKGPIRTLRFAVPYNNVFYFFQSSSHLCWMTTRVWLITQSSVISPSNNGCQDINFLHTIPCDSFSSDLLL